jgi:3-deoxy-D-manno-octulosonic-acid transferase
MLLLYRIAFIAMITFGSPYLFLKAFFGHHGIRERLGFIPKREGDQKLFWFHAASVGELKVLSTVIPELRKLRPDLKIAISTTTATGRRRAEDLFERFAIIFQQPLEINSAILRVIENLRPNKLILIETEIWPLMISTAAQSGIEINLINARMSQKSYDIYKWFKPLLRQVFQNFSKILAQTEDDAGRFNSLGAKNVEVIGNTKFDQVFEKGSANAALSNPDKDKLVFVAGSIRKGEDQIFAELISRSREKRLAVFFILVPRHLKDIDELCGQLQNRKIEYTLWSETENGKIDYNSVLIVNTMGELANFYLSADLAFVGGSLVPVGGHDPAEPAALCKPILFGPNMENTAQAARLLVDSGGAEIVENGLELYEALSRAVQNRAALAEKGRKCHEAILTMAGVSKKTAKIIAGDKP